MKKLLFAAPALFLLWTSPARSQGTSVGVLLGGSRAIEEGFSLGVSDPVKQVYLMLELEQGTRFRIQVGEADLSRTLGFRPSADADRLEAGYEGDVQYVATLVEYHFDEVFGSTTLFGGPGLYKQRFQRLTGDDPYPVVLDDSSWGLQAGVGGNFPITRRFSFVAELAYHWVSASEIAKFGEGATALRVKNSLVFTTAGAGVKVRF